MPPLLTNDFLPQRISSLSEWFSPWTTGVLPWWLVSHQWMISELDKLSPSLMNAVSSIDELPPPVCFTGRLIQWAPPSFDDWSLGPCPPPLPRWMVSSLPPTLTNGLILPSANDLLSQWTTPLLIWRCRLRFIIRRWELRLQVVNLSYIYGTQ